MGARARVVALFLPVLLQSKERIDIARAGRLGRHLTKNREIREHARTARRAVGRQVADARRSNCGGRNGEQGSERSQAEEVG